MRPSLGRSKDDQLAQWVQNPEIYYAVFRYTWLSGPEPSRPEKARLLSALREYLPKVRCLGEMEKQFAQVSEAYPDRLVYSPLVPQILKDLEIHRKP